MRLEMTKEKNSKKRVRMLALTIILALCLGAMAACGQNGGPDGAGSGGADGAEDQGSGAGSPSGAPAYGDEDTGDTADGDKASDADDGEEPNFTSFTSEDLDGNKVDQSVWSDYKLTMVNVWATSCGYCIKEMPDLEELNNEYKDKGVQVVGVLLDALNRDLTVNKGRVDTAKEILEKKGASFKQLIPSEDLLYAGIGSIRNTPTNFFLDKEGNLVGGSAYSGARGKDKLEELIDEHLELVEKAETK